MKFTIETVSKMTGIPAPSLRNWEKRYGFPQPTRTEGGHRFYDSMDIDFLKRAAAWIEEGYNLGQIAEIYKTEKSLRTQAEKVISPIPLQAQNIFDDVDYRVDLLYQALLKFDMLTIQQHYLILNAKLSLAQLFDRVIECILRRLGADWVAGQVSIAQEHFVSSFLRMKMASFLAIEFMPTQKHSVFAATLTDEKHEGGLILLSAHLKFKGYPIYYFGSELPFVDLKMLCLEKRPAVMLLSYVHLEHLRRDLPLLAEFKVPVVIGGLALHDPILLSDLRGQAPPNIHFCDKKNGSEAAQFIELICQAKISSV